MVSQPRVLVIEDNRNLQLEICRLLRASRLITVSAFDGLEGLVHFDRDKLDLLIINLGLPGLNGLEVCRRIRQRSYVPIMMLSPVKNNATKIAAFDLGADDYVVLPLETDEFVARVRALLRRSTWARLPAFDAFRLGPLEIDASSHQVLRNGKNIRLSRTEWALLNLLMRRVGLVQTHQSLSQQLWDDDSEEGNVKLRVTVGRLRKKLEDDPANPQFILTEPGIGYWLARPEIQDSSPLHLLAGSPVIRPARPSLNNLPGQSAPFFGREAEIEHIRNLLLRPTVRLVTLIGAGGAGKTRLSLQAALSIQTAFEHGVFLIQLSYISDPALVTSRIAQALGVKENARQPLAETLQEFLSDKQVLLILDNFEHLVTAAKGIAELLDAAPNVRVLVTSRIRLKLAGEHLVEVPPLPLPDPANLPPLDLLARYPSIALFTEHARTIQPEFELNSENAAAVTTICVRLDGLPLAIELVARRIRVLTPAAMLARLSTNLLTQMGDEQDRPERHHTMRSALDWSYTLLSPSERILFAQLAVFVGGFTLEAAEALCTIPDDADFSVIDGLLSLLDKSMLQQHTEPMFEGYSTTRFTMIGLLHEYAQERLAESPEADRWRERHALYYLSFAEQANAELVSPREAFWHLQLERDYDNLQAAIEWALTNAHNTMALRLCAVLWKFWHVYGFQNSGKRWLDVVLARTADFATADRANVLYGAGWIYYDLGDWQHADRFFTESLKLARKLDDRYGIAEALHGVGEIATLRGDHVLATAYFQESLELGHEIDSKESIAWSLEHLGRTAYQQGDHVSAINLIGEALRQFRELGFQRGMAYALGNLGAITLQLGDLEQAIPYLQESINLHEKVGDRLGRVVYLFRLAEAFYYKGDLDEAEALGQASLGSSNELGYRWYRALALSQLAQVAIATERYTDAEAHLSQALRLSQTVYEGIVGALEGFAELAAAQHHYTEAARLYSAMIAARQHSGTALPPINRIREGRLLDALHANLSESEFAAAWEQGQAMAPQSLEEIFKLINPDSVTDSVTPL